MKFLNPLFLITFTSIVHATIQKRDANTTLNDIRTINSQTAQVQTSIDNFPGGPLSALQALKIQTDATTLDETIKRSTRNVQGSQPFTEAESAAIATSVTGLQPAIFKVLDSLVAKKKGFETAIFGASAVPIVKDTLVKLRADTAAFGGNLTQKFTPEIRAVAPLVISNIDFHFARAVDAFS